MVLEVSSSILGRLQLKKNTFGTALLAKGIPGDTKWPSIHPTKMYIQNKI